MSMNTDWYHLFTSYSQLAILALLTTGLSRKTASFRLASPSLGIGLVDVQGLAGGFHVRPHSLSREGGFGQASEQGGLLRTVYLLLRRLSALSFYSYFL